ncbi:MAG: hypothetical protein ABIP48_02050 [Planctomycetota bacterium]
MPRIAAALAVFLTVVTCIGFNTARYPMVWEMVAARDGLSQSREADEPAGSTQPAAAPQSASFTESRPGANSTAFWESSAESAETTSWESATVEPISAYSSDTAYAADPAEGSSRGPTEGAPIVVDDYAPIDSIAMREPPASAGAAFDPVAPGNSVSRPTATKRRLENNSGTVPVFPQGKWDCPPPKPGRTDSLEETTASPVGKPVEASAAKKYASSAFDAAESPIGNAAYSTEHAEEKEEATNTAWNDKPDSPSTLVPVKPPNAGQGGFPARDAETSLGASAVAGAGVRKGTSSTKRLPPVDAVSSAAGANHWPPRPADSIPIYPTTGAR